MSETRLFSYVVWDDGGLAPNPYFGICTLNVCKPLLRRAAEVGDWVAGFVGSNRPGERGRLIYAMRVTEKFTMVEYDALTRRELPGKIPAPFSRDYRRRAGDSLYNFGGPYPVQRRGYHGPENMPGDLSGRYTLLSDSFYYFGADPLELPEELRPVIHVGRAHKWKPNARYVDPFAEWLTSRYEPGCVYALPHSVVRSMQRVDIGQKSRK